MYVDRAIGINGSCIPTQRNDLAQDTHGLVGEGFEVLGIDAGSRLGSHSRQVVTEKLIKRARG